jgi:hypothetical protein
MAGVKRVAGFTFGVLGGIFALTWLGNLGRFHIAPGSWVAMELLFGLVAVGGFVVWRQGLRESRERRARWAAPSAQGFPAVPSEPDGGFTG